ncbi:MAG: sugar phosphate nucleotidyltransferase [Kofleriaceae bacterium]
MIAGALIMAGGDGSRMAAIGAPKPLVKLRGASLLERSLWALLGAGVTEVWVACRHDQHPIVDEVTRLAASAGRRGVQVRALIEPEPLGTIGAAALLRDRVELLVTVNADNLTALELAGLLAHHTRTRADLTLATHDHWTRLPYGEIAVDGERVTAYREKPVTRARVASAVCVLGPAAIAAISGRTGVHELVAKLLVTGGHVVANHHAEPWIDINEPADLARAERLVAQHAERFECWARPPDLEVAGALVHDGDHLLLERRADTRLWDTPGGKLEPGEPPARAIARELYEELGLVVAPPAACGRFDTLEADGRAIRHHVFAVAVERGQVRPCEGQTLEWFQCARLPRDRAPVVDRSLAGERG